MLHPGGRHSAESAHSSCFIAADRGACERRSWRGLTPPARQGSVSRWCRSRHGSSVDRKRELCLHPGTPKSYLIIGGKWRSNHWRRDDPLLGCVPLRDLAFSLRISLVRPVPYQCVSTADTVHTVHTVPWFSGAVFGKGSGACLPRQ